MKVQQWTYQDRSDWANGEWDNEPDKIQWLDEATGLPCLIVRNHVGALCGYVGVAESHPAFGVNYNDIKPYPEVHGGLTFSDFCSPDPDNKEHGICHVVEDGESDRVWWLGFDCAHCFDLMPAMRRFRYAEPTDQYRNVAYVQGECRNLASQLMVKGKLRWVNEHEPRNLTMREPCLIGWKRMPMSHCLTILNGAAF